MMRNVNFFLKNSIKTGRCGLNGLNSRNNFNGIKIENGKYVFNPIFSQTRGIILPPPSEKEIEKARKKWEVKNIQDVPYAKLPKPQEVGFSNLDMTPLRDSKVGLFARIVIHKQKFLVTLGDLIRLPFKLKNVRAGSEIKINLVESIGNNRYVAQGSPYINSNQFNISAVVLEHTRQPYREIIKTEKRRKEYRRIRIKMPYTVIRISQLDVNVDV